MLNWAEEISYTKEHQKTFISYSLHLFRMSILNNYQQEKELLVSERDGLSKLRHYYRNNIELFMKKFNEAYRSIIECKHKDYVFAIKFLGNASNTSS